MFSLIQGEEKLLFFQFPDVLPIKPASVDQEEPMPVDEASNEQPAAEETVCILLELVY